MPEPERIQLFDGEISEGTKSYQGVYLDEAGDLVLEAQDLGKAARESWGDSDYEYWIRVREPNKQTVLVQLREELGTTEGGDEDGELLALIERKYRGNPAASFDFQRWLDAKGIPYEFSSYA